METRSYYLTSNYFYMLLLLKWNLNKRKRVSRHQKWEDYRESHVGEGWRIRTGTLSPGDYFTQQTSSLVSNGDKKCPNREKPWPFQEKISACDKLGEARKVLGDGVGPPQYRCLQQLQGAQHLWVLFIPLLCSLHHWSDSWLYFPISVHSLTTRSDGRTWLPSIDCKYSQWVSLFVTWSPWLALKPTNQFGSL